MTSENPPAASPAEKGWDLRHPAVFLATGFGAGLLPRAPGTWGSLLAVGLAWGIVQVWGPAGLAVGAALAFGVGVWVSGVCIDKYGAEDPKQVVVDEIAGQWLVLLVVPPGLLELREVQGVVAVDPVEDRRQVLRQLPEAPLELARRVPRRGPSKPPS